MNEIKKLIKGLLGYGVQVTSDTLWCYFPDPRSASMAAEKLRSSGYIQVTRCGCSVRVEGL